MIRIAVESRLTDYGKSFRRLVQILGLCGVAGTQIRAAEPNLVRLEPQGGQRGTEVEVSLLGGRLEDAEGFLFSRPGISVSEIKPAAGNDGKAKFSIAPDCPLGQHPLRLRTKTGLSYLVTFWVSQYPNVGEVEPNSDFSAPQAIPMGSTVNGVVQNEDVDYYIVEAKKGQRISAEVEALRLGSNGGVLFDPAVAILDQRRFELAFADDTSLLLQDSYCSTVAPEDGKYVVMVREASYAGNDNYRYRLHVGSFPRPGQVFPAGGPAGKETEFRFLGASGEDLGTRKITLPENSAGATHETFLDENGAFAASPNLIRISAYPNVLESEPNNAREQATPAGGDLPIAFNGIISEDGDVDFFKFAAKKDQSFDFVVYARTIGSPLDPVITIFKADGNAVVENDDATNGKLDSRAAFKAPEDGEYMLSIRDHLGKGSPGHGYRVESEAPLAELGLTTPEFSNNDSQHRQMIVVPRGGRFATMVNVQKRGVGGVLEFFAENLPAGVKLNAGEMPDGIGDFPMIFEASPDAPLASNLSDLKVRPLDENWKGKLEGRYRHKINIVQANPNNTVYYDVRTDHLPVAVVEKVPFSIEVDKPSVPLVQGGQMSLKVRVRREEGFAGALTLHMLWRPPGLGSPNSIAIPADQSEGVFVIDGAGDARPGTWKLALMAESPADQGRMFNAADYVELTVSPPFLALEQSMATVEIGKETDLVCKVNQMVPFEGSARAELFGLPANVVTEPVAITKETEQVVFKIKTDQTSPVGKHQQVFCRVMVPQNGSEIQHNTGGGTVLRIDPPPPPKPAAADKPAEAPKPETPKPAEPTDAPKKPLSRLEELRIRAQGGQE